MSKKLQKTNEIDSKRMTLENMPFIVVELAILITYMMKLADKTLMVPILFFIIGGQQIYNALRFYRNDPKLKKFYFACGFGSFAAGMFLFLNNTMLN